MSFQIRGGFIRLDKDTYVAIDKIATISVYRYGESDGRTIICAPSGTMLANVEGDCMDEIVNLIEESRQ